MNYLKIATGIAILATASLTACKKKNNESTAHANIVGKWKETYAVIDSNKNNKMDSQEYVPVTVPTFLTFSSDGTGKIETNSSSLSFSVPLAWALVNNDADLRLVLIDSSGNDTTTVHLSTLTSSQMIMSSSGGISTMEWDIFEKQ